MTQAGWRKGVPALPPGTLTWHVNHFAVAVFHNIPGLAVDPASRDTVNGKEV